MTYDSHQNYSRWKPEDLRRAEASASRFLEENAEPIAQSIQARLSFLEQVVRRLSQQGITLEERLDCFARISEIARLLEQDAQSIFELASQPLVARLLRRD